MPKATAFVTALLNHFFNNSAFANLGDATGLPASAGAGSLYISFHSADPGKAGDQTTNELSYTGYARVAVPRSSAGWTISGSQVTNTALIQFALCTAGSGTANFIGIGTQPSGAGVLLYYSPYSLSNQGPFTAVASTDIVTIPGHSLSVNDTVVMYAAFGSSLPTGITSGTTYFVKTVSGQTITLSATSGGATLDITGDGDGVIYKTSNLPIANNITPQIAIGQLIVIED